MKTIKLFESDFDKQGKRNIWRIYPTREMRTLAIRAFRHFYPELNYIIGWKDTGGAGPTEKQVYRNNVALKLVLNNLGFDTQWGVITCGGEKLEVIQFSIVCDQFGELDQASLQEVINFFKPKGAK